MPLLPVRGRRILVRNLSVAPVGHRAPRCKAVRSGLTWLSQADPSPTGREVAQRAASGRVATTVTASGALVAQKHNAVDATAANRTMTLPTGQVEGTTLSVEKTDSSANLVSVTGSSRGVAARRTALPRARERITFRAHSSGSCPWWPVSGHKTKASLDAAFARA